MRFYRWFILGLLVLVGALLLFQPKEVVEDPPPETEDLTHLSYSSRVNVNEDVRVGPYVSKKGAGASITFPF